MSAVNSKILQALFPLLTVALLATACSDSTGPSTGTEGSDVGSPSAPLPGSSAQTPSALPAGPQLAAATISSTWGQVGRVATPYPSARCWGTNTPVATEVSRRLSLLGATVDPAQVMGPSERVSQQVFLYKWTSTGWTAFPPRIATKSVGPVTMPTVTFSELTPGYYKVVTRFTWSVYTTSGWSTIGSKVVNYSMASDYTAAYGGQAGPGYCYLP
jgi:hypothetical protein